MTKIVIFGAGYLGKKLMNYSPKDEVNVIGIVDNDKTKWGKEINGYKIDSPDTYIDKMVDLIIVAVEQGRFDIYDQLVNMGIEKEKIELCLDEKGINRFNYLAGKYFDFVGFPVKKPFKKGAPTDYKITYLETSKAHDRRKRESFFEKYCIGEGLDIGWGGDLLSPNCSVWDVENGDAQYLKGIEDEMFDFVYSSHCLEHMYDVRIALKNWFRVVKRGGYLIIAIPHRDLYEKKDSLPSRWNEDHKHMFLIGKEEAPDTLDIVKEIKESLVDYDIKYIKACDDGWTISDPLIHSNGEYQIEIVIKKSTC